MRLKDLMTTELQTVPSNATLAVCAKVMAEYGIGSIPVCDGDQLVGIVTDRDLVVRGMAERKESRSTLVREVMSEPVFSLHEEEEDDKAAVLMEVKQIRRVPIVDREGRLVGIVSLGDIASKTKDENLSGEILEKISEPTRGRAA